MTFNLKANMKPTKMKTKIKLFASGDRRHEDKNFSLNLKKTDFDRLTVGCPAKGGSKLV